jgi:hypothetical protein
MTGPHGDFFVCGFVLEKPSQSQPSGGFILYQRHHRHEGSVVEHADSIRKPMARCYLDGGFSSFFASLAISRHVSNST